MKPFDIRDNIPDEMDALTAWAKENYGQGMLNLARQAERDYTLGSEAFALVMSEVPIVDTEVQAAENFTDPPPAV